MKKCPGQQKIAALGLGGLPQTEAEAVLKHIASCPKCRRTAEQFHRLQVVLQHTKPQPDGSFQFAPPALSAAAVEDLKESVVAEFKQREHWRSKLKARVKQLWWDWVGKAPDFEVAPPLFGYAATRPRKGSKTKRTARARLSTELQESLTDLLEVLLDPATPLEQRVKWATQIKSKLRRMAELPSEQGTSSRKQALK